MKTTRLILGFGMAASLVLTSTSCQKYKLNRSTTSSEDNSLAEVGFNDILKVTEDAIKEEELDGRASSAFQEIYSGCASVTVSPADLVTFPKTITIDFGTTNCTGTDGRSRRGVLNITMSGLYRDAGSVITITPSNYFVNDYKVEGTKTITNSGRNTDGNLEFAISIVNGIITTPDNDQITWESTRTREWVAGESTSFVTHGLSGLLDDEYLITGSASGTDRDGRDYTATITQALRVALACQWIKEGTIELQPEDLKLRTIDFGAGACDNVATITIDNRTYTFYMR
jgi:hypothetical protein